MDDKKDLADFARSYAEKNKDLYDLLSVSPDAAPPEIHRAWRKASLKHHPDKAGSNFDPELWQDFERARDVLSSPEARAVYDNARAAAVRREKELAAATAEHRRMVEDLERRERGEPVGFVDAAAARRRKMEAEGRLFATDAERQAQSERGSRHREERRRQMAEAEARERERKKRKEQEEESERQKNLAQAQTQTHTSTDHDTSRPSPPPPPAANGDDLDQREAEIRHRLAEKAAKKAARKADKQHDKSKKHKLDDHDSQQDHGRAPPASRPNIDHPGTSATPDTQPPVTKKPGDFSSTMAKLRAAQREKERRKAEAAAQAMDTQ